jgi:UDP-N-acetylmuramate dehydrogenase
MIFVYTLVVFSVTISLLNIREELNQLASLQSHHTFALDAQCPRISTIDSVDSLVSTLKELLLSSSLEDIIVMGEGSNTVFVDDVNHCVILNRIKGLDITQTDDAYHLCVGAGENWHELVSHCIAKDVGGFENLALIPGTVGAAPIQNIGAYGVEIEKYINKVEFLDTQSMSVDVLERDQCHFAYRDSIFKGQTPNRRIITRVFFELPKTYELCLSYGPLQKLELKTPEDVFKAVIEVRQSKLPDVKVLGNAGSFFKNPVVTEAHFAQLIEKFEDIPHFAIAADQVKIPAAWLIDTLGFKGKRKGNIACHKDQPLVLVNLGGGKGDDLLAMARDIKGQVKDTFGINLENEVRLMGKNGLILI